jgi:DNA-binding MarR family transcriptional regulator/L-amino acid N-acyltransferase YncA
MENLSVHAINQLRQNARCVVRGLGLLNDAYFEIGVTLAERHLLLELYQTTPTMGEIADRLLLDKSTVSRLIDKAEKKGYVQCVPDRKDKRKRFLVITSKGTETVNTFEPIAFNQTKEALTALNSQEIETVYKGMALYARGLKSSRLKQNDTPLAYQQIESSQQVVQQLTKLEVTVTPFTQNDEDGLYAIFQEVVDSGSQFPYECSSRQEFHRQFLQLPERVYVCHNATGEVIGGFYIRPNFPGRASHIANAAYMMRANARGRGIGSLAIKASLHLACSFGYQTMQFNLVLSKNVLAVKLYERLGFTITGTIPNAVRSGDNSYQDGYIMHRSLHDLRDLL